MSDEAQEMTAPEVPAQEAPAAEAHDARLEHSTARLERLVGAEPPAPQAAPAAEPKSAVAPPARPAEHPATASWRERRRQEIEHARRETERQVLERLEQRVAQLASHQAELAPPATAAPEDPEPQAEQFRDDWSYQQAWIAWNGRQQQRQILTEIQKQVGPVLDQVKRANETQEQYQERVQQEAAVRGEMERRRALFVSSEQDYAATPEGEGYYDRFVGFYGHPGAPQHGVPPLDGILTRALVRGGVPLEDARRATFMSVQALGEVGTRYGIPPPVMVDGYMREILESAAAGFPGAAAPNGNGVTPAAPAVHPAAKKGQEEVRRLKAAAAAAGEAAGSLSDGAGGKPQPPNFKRPIRTKKDLEEVVAGHFGGDWREAGKAFRKAIHELRQAGG